MTKYKYSKSSSFYFDYKKIFFQENIFKSYTNQ